MIYPDFLLAKVPRTFHEIRLKLAEPEPKCNSLSRFECVRVHVIIKLLIGNIAVSSSFVHSSIGQAKLAFGTIRSLS